MNFLPPASGPKNKPSKNQRETDMLAITVLSIPKYLFQVSGLTFF
jgi:hypothetical protein